MTSQSYVWRLQHTLSADDICSDSPPVFSSFVNLPSRTIVDYYRVIKNPVSLKSVQKAVRGIRGRDKPTNMTFLKSWAAFEEEIAQIWHNARTYNEDGSDIYVLAGELEVCGLDKTHLLW